MAVELVEATNGLFSLLKPIALSLFVYDKLKKKTKRNRMKI